MNFDELYLAYIKDYIRKEFIITDRFLIYSCEIIDDTIKVNLNHHPYWLYIKIKEYNIYLRNDKINKLKEKLKTK